jgi:hypothetical protein
LETLAWKPKYARYIMVGDQTKVVGEGWLRLAASAVLAATLPVGGMLITVGIWIGGVDADLTEIKDDAYLATDAIIEVAENLEELEDAVNTNSSHDAVIDTKLGHIEKGLEDLKDDQKALQREQQKAKEAILEAIEELTKEQ